MPVASHLSLPLTCLFILPVHSSTLSFLFTPTLPFFLTSFVLPHIPPSISLDIPCCPPFSLPSKFISSHTWPWIVPSYFSLTFSPSQQYLFSFSYLPSLTALCMTASLPSHSNLFPLLTLSPFLSKPPLIFPIFIPLILHPNACCYLVCPYYLHILPPPCSNISLHDSLFSSLYCLVHLSK